MAGVDTKLSHAVETQVILGSHADVSRGSSSLRTLRPRGTTAANSECVNSSHQVYGTPMKSVCAGKQAILEASLLTTSRAKVPEPPMLGGGEASAWPRG